MNLVVHYTSFNLTIFIFLPSPVNECEYLNFLFFNPGKIISQGYKTAHFWKFLDGRHSFRQ